jgi:prolyl oligopeptidase
MAGTRRRAAARRLALAAIALASWPAVAEVAPAPVARREEFVETKQGVEIRDPYRWMEAGGAEFDALLRAEDAYARGILAGIPGRDAWHRRVLDFGGDAPWFGAPQAGGGRTLLTEFRIDSPTPTFSLLSGSTRAALGDLARLHDPSGRHTIVPHSLVLSPDGRWLTVGLSRDGEADPVLRVYDVARRRLLPERLTWPLYADARGFRPRWLADSSGYYYVRNPARTADTPAVEREWRGRVYLHRLGRPHTDDVALFGHGSSDGIAPDDTLYVEGAPDPGWLVVYNRRANGRELWAAPIAADGRPAGAFRRLHTARIAPAGWGVSGDELHVASANDAGDVEVLAIALRGDVPPRTLLAAGERVWSALAATEDGTYLVRRDGGEMSLHRLGRDGSLVQIALPAAGSIAMLQPAAGGGVEFRLDGWLSSARWLRVAPRAATAIDTGLMPRVGPDASAYVAQLVLAEARDGALVPVTLLRRRDLPRDGRAPVILHAYGCFGSPLDAEYIPENLAWLERGGVFAVAHVRGGGDLGPRWQLAGRDRNKPTAIEDIVDAAAHLVRLGWTSSGRIAGEGSSCGGMTVGRAALERPDLFGAALLRVGHLDATRDNDASYRRSIYDIGDPDTTEGVRRMLRLAPYHSILPGEHAPAVLLLNGANDYTIPPWHGTKFVARLRSEAAPGRPALLRVNWSGGHSVSASAEDGVLQQTADGFAFAWWQLTR